MFRGKIFVKMSEYINNWRKRAIQHDAQKHGTMGLMGSQLASGLEGINDPSCSLCNDAYPLEKYEEFKKFWQWFKGITTAQSYSALAKERFIDLLNLKGEIIWWLTPINDNNMV